MPLKSAEDRRRSRNIVFAALATLFVIYFVKFAFPQHTVGTVISQHYSKGSTAVGDTSSDPAAAIKAGKAAVSAAMTGTSSARRPAATMAIPQVTGGYNGTIYDKVAIIIEDRPRTNLIPLILHFSTVLGPSWPIIIYTSSENVGTFASSAALGRYLRSGVVSIRILPSSVLFTNSDSVSAFLTKPWLWQDLAPAKHVLLFQSDSMLCANAARSVEDFFEYDFVGAPIAPNLGAGMNGGLSLRKRETILRILDEWDWEKEKGRRFEDLWYFDRLHEIIKRQEANGVAEGEEEIVLPSLEVARTFSVETIDFPHPLGVHQVHRWLGEQMVSLDEWCPEWKLCSGDFIKDSH